MKPRALRLRDRITLSFGVLLALVIVVAATALLQVRGLADAAQRQAQLGHLQRQVVLWNDLTSLNVSRTLALAKAGSAPQLSAWRGWMAGEMAQTSARISVLQKELEAALVEPGERQLGFGEVNQAVAQLDRITQQNAALVEEAAAAAQSLKDQAGGLVVMVARFRLAA